MSTPEWRRWAPWALLSLGATASLLAVVLAPDRARSAALQSWPPFVLVTGLLAIGVVAEGDGLFDVAGALVARRATSATTLFLGGVALVAVVTALLNLDTAVAFVTPILVVGARRSNVSEAPLLYGALFMANGASTLLVGSNLTNLIVLRDSSTTAGSFIAHMALPWFVGCCVIALTLSLVFHRDLTTRIQHVRELAATRGVIGLLVIIGALAAMLSAPPEVAAPVVVGLAVIALAARLGQRHLTPTDVTRWVNGPVVVGLFGLAVGAGVLGRSWPALGRYVAHSPDWRAAVIGAGAAVVLNNLPAAALLSAHHLASPYGLLIGLNLGPNLAVTGALSALIWLQVGRAVGAAPSPRTLSRIGVVVAPLSVAGALGALRLVH